MARAGINWARGIDELGQGLLRQVDIGGKAYEGAMAKEAEQRAADRELAREMRAAERADKMFEKESTRWIEQQEILQGYNIDNLIKRAELQEEADLKKFGRESAFTLKTWRMERYAAIRDLESKAKTERQLLDIKNNVSRAESADKRVTSILTALSKAMKDGETAESDRLSRELEQAELQATEAWARIPGVDPLTTRQLTEFQKFGIIGGEIVSAISLETGENVFRQAITAIKQGEGSSGYDAAYETVSRTIDRIIENNPTFKNYRGVKKRDLKKHIIEKLLPEVELGEATVDVKDPPKDEGNGVVSEVFSADPAYQAGVGFGKAIGDIIESFKGLGDMGVQIQGSAIGSRIKQWETEEGLKPEEVIARIKEQVTKAPAGERKVWQIFLERLDPNQGAMLESPGMVNPRGGMIFEADRMPMDAASVNARYTV